MSIYFLWSCPDGLVIASECWSNLGDELSLKISKRWTCLSNGDKLDWGGQKACGTNRDVENGDKRGDYCGEISLSELGSDSDSESDHQHPEACTAGKRIEKSNETRLCIVHGLWFRALLYSHMGEGLDGG